MLSFSVRQLDASTLQALRVQAVQQQLGDLAVKLFQPALQVDNEPPFELPPREHDAAPDCCP